MDFMNWIVTRLNELSGLFYNIYLETLDWVYPFWLVAGWFYSVSQLFNDLAYRFSDFGSWVNLVGFELTRILDWSTIWSLILTNLPDLSNVGQWLSSWYVNVLEIITGWWGGTQLTVQTWIDNVNDWAGLQITSLTTWLSSLQGEWDAFKSSTLPSLADWSGIDTLIASWFANFAPFWDGWLDIKSQVEEFFNDPEQFVYDRLESFFVRFW